MPKPSNVLSGLPKKLLSELFEGAVAHKLRDGEVLFRAGDVGDGCYRIQTGLVKVVVSSERGEERIIYGTAKYCFAPAMSATAAIESRQAW